MIVANPIYDIVFKYLMEDERIARTILSALLKKDVVAVEIRPHEYSDESRDSLSVFRIDFGATIRESDGKERKINIIVKKVRLTDEPSFFIISVIEGLVIQTKYIGIKGITLDRLISDKYYKTLNLFHQMYQIGNDKHELTQFESIYSNDEDLFYILNFLESINNSDIKKEMLKEDEYVFFNNRDNFIESYENQMLRMKAQLSEKDEMLRTTVKMLLDGGKQIEEIAKSLGKDYESIKNLI